MAGGRSDIEEHGFAVTLQPDVEPQHGAGAAGVTRIGGLGGLGAGAISVSRRSSAMEARTGSAALAAGSSGKYIRVTRRSSRPRANTVTSRCGASVAPAGVRRGQRAGLERDDPVASRPARSGTGRSRGTRHNRPPTGRAGRPGGRTGPSGSACQVSTSPSGIDVPGPVVQPPDDGDRAGRVRGHHDTGRPARAADARNGPTVCDGVSPARSFAVRLRLEHGRLRAAQHDVAAVAEGPFGLGQLDVERGRPCAARACGSGTELKIGSMRRAAGRPGSTSGSPAAG